MGWHNLVLALFVGASSLHSQETTFFNIDSTKILVYSEGNLVQEISVGQFIGNGGKSTKNEKYEITYIEDQFSELRIYSDSVLFRFNEDCFVYCGMSIFDVAAALEGGKMHMRHDSTRIYFDVKYMYRGKWRTPDEEHFYLFLKDEKVEYISYSRIVDGDDY